MSDPVSNADIEDVLSSIRRLVTEDVSPPERPAKSAPGRLVLTPALRVMDSDKPEEVRSDAVAETAGSEHSEHYDAAEPETLPQPELVEGHELFGISLDNSGKRNLEARIAELEAVIADTGGQWEQDGEEGSANAGAPVDRMEWEPEPAGPMVEEAHTDTDPVEAEMAEMVESDPAIDSLKSAVMPFLHPSFTVPADTGVEVLPEPVSEIELEVVEPDDSIEAPTIEVVAVASMEPVVDLVPLADETEELREAKPDHYASVDLPAGAEAEQEAEAVAIDEVVPEVAEIAEHQPAVADAVDDKPETATAEAYETAVPDAGLTLEDDYDGQDFVVDEEALRALVTEIVHQELKGALGERITRNVRNLVRREIHRALASQELE